MPNFIDNCLQKLTFKQDVTANNMVCGDSSKQREGSFGLKCSYIVIFLQINLSWMAMKENYPLCIVTRLSGSDNVDMTYLIKSMVHDLK